MARVSVEVPGELVAPVRETVLLLYLSTSESLHLSLKAHSERRGALADVHQHRARLAQLDELLGQLGWQGAAPGGAAPGGAAPAGAPPGAGPVELRAPPDLLHDALYGALIDAGERLASASTRAWRGELPAERVQAAAHEVLALHALLRALEEMTSAG
jgi:hypothetical protein